MLATAARVLPLLALPLPAAGVLGIRRPSDATVGWLLVLPLLVAGVLASCAGGEPAREAQPSSPTEAAAEAPPAEPPSGPSQGAQPATQPSVAASDSDDPAQSESPEPRSGASEPPSPVVQFQPPLGNLTADVDNPPEVVQLPLPAPPPTDVPAPTVVAGRDPLPDSSPREDVPSALTDPLWPGFPSHVDPALIKGGGPPPDGIPSIDSPVFAPAGEVGFLEPQEAVLALEVNGDARAYPLQIMTRHELVNDRVGGVPVTVSYCPLCNSAVAYDRRAGGRVLDFGTSGSLYQSSLVMYDRQTQTLWTHFDGTAVVGELAGTVLHVYPIPIVSWAEWLAAYPDGTVLSTQSGYGGGYGRNPYVGYETRPGLLNSAFQSVPFDDRLAPKERVIGIRGPSEGDAVAVRHACLRRDGVINVEVGGVPLVVWNLPGARSAIDSARVSEGREVGSTGVFVRSAGGHADLVFSRTADGFSDAETGSSWNVFGAGVAGPQSGARLEPMEFLDTFWFAWAAFEPTTRIAPEPAEAC